MQRHQQLISRAVGTRLVQRTKSGVGALIPIVLDVLLMSGCTGDNHGDNRGDNQSSFKAVEAPDIANTAFVFSNGSPFGVDATSGPVTLTFGIMLDNIGPFQLEAGGARATGEVTFHSCDLRITNSTFAASQGPQVGQILQLQPCEIDPATGALRVENAFTLATATSAPGSPVTAPPRGNGALVAVDDQGTTVEDIAVALLVLRNDISADGAHLTITQITPGTHGTTALTAADTVHYTPAPGFHGTDSFT